MRIGGPDCPVYSYLCCGNGGVYCPVYICIMGTIVHTVLCISLLWERWSILSCIKLCLSWELVVQTFLYICVPVVETVVNTVLCIVHTFQYVVFFVVEMMVYTPCIYLSVKETFVHTILFICISGVGTVVPTTL